MEIAIIVAVVVIAIGVTLWFQVRKQPDMVVKVTNPDPLANTIRDHHD